MRPNSWGNRMVREGPAGSPTETTETPLWTGILRAAILADGGKLTGMILRPSTGGRRIVEIEMCATGSGRSKRRLTTNLPEV
jgi:hypothetical protein